MFKGHAGQPFNSNMDVFRGFFPAGHFFQVAATRGAGADKNGVVVFFQHILQTLCTRC